MKSSDLITFSYFNVNMNSFNIALTHWLETHHLKNTVESLTEITFFELRYYK